MKRIFVSYRRSDAGGWAGRVASHLRQVFGHECHIFHDVSSKELGENYRSRVETEAANSDLLLAIVGPEWAGMLEARLKQSGDDLVRLELDAARSSDVRVIPVLVGGVTLAHLQELPEDLLWLSSIQAFTLQVDEAESDLEELSNRLSHLLELRPQPTRPQDPPRQVAAEVYVENQTNIDKIVADNSVINL